MQKTKDLIDRIVKNELEMFLSVKAQGESTCQEHPDTFMLHRRAQFSPWSEDALTSYLEDLTLAKKEGINLMTLKYARMDNLVPKQNPNPLILEIVSIQYQWQEELFEKYPRLMANARPISRESDSKGVTSFETYLEGELETYSDTTLSLLHKDIVRKQKEGINMTEEIYDFLVKESGFASIEEAEAAHPPKP